jgi:hypothetical protein
MLHAIDRNQSKETFLEKSIACCKVGLNTDCVDQLKEEDKFISYKFVPLENKKIGFEVTWKDQQYVFTPEQVLVFFLRRN